MLKKGDIVTVNQILIHALLNTQHLPQFLKNALNKLAKYGHNPVKIEDIITKNDSYEFKLKVQESYSYNSRPAVMCEGYNCGHAETHIFETLEQADYALISDKTDSQEFVNLSPETIQATQIVRLVYNNKNLMVIPVTPTQISEYQSVIGKAMGNILPYEKGKVKLLTPCQLMDNKTFLSLTVRGLRTN